MRPLILKKNALALVLLLLTAAGAAPSHAGVDRGVMKIDFLYSIESAGGRGDQLKAPVDIFYDREADELYVVDGDNRGVLVYSGNGVFLQELQESRKMGNPRTVATDSDGRIYVGHGNSPWISVLNFRGEFLDQILIPGAVDVPQNKTYVQFLARGPEGGVYVFKSTGGMVRLDAAKGNHQEVVLPEGENSANMVSGMTVDPKGRILFSDMRPYSVSVLDSEKKLWSRIGDAGILYGQIARPVGVAVDGSGHVFVTSLIRHKVLCYAPDGGFIEEFGGIGKGYGRFYMPTRIVSDGKDRIFVLEQPMKRIQVFRVAFPGEEKVLTSANRGS